MEEKLLYKYIIGKTDEAENELIYAWLQESDEHRKELFELKNIMNATRSEGRAVMDADAFMRGVSEKIARKKTALLMRRLCSAAAAILLLVGLAFAGKGWVNAFPEVYVNAGDRVVCQVLEDSSRVWLKPGAELSVARKYGRRARRVKLDGSAYFEVTHNAKAPFTVSAWNDISVRVLGTAFCIDADSLGTEVVLERGSVRVENKSGDRAMLLPGQSAISRNGKFELKNVDASRKVSMEYDLVTLPNASIDDILREVESEYHVQLSCEAADTTRRYTFNYRHSNTIDEVLQIITSLIGEKVTCASGR